MVNIVNGCDVRFAHCQNSAILLARNNVTRLIPTGPAHGFFFLSLCLCEKSPMINSFFFSNQLKLAQKEKKTPNPEYTTGKY